jgi:hypothetical protein
MALEFIFAATYKENTPMQKKHAYEAPKVITYSEDEIVEMLGPAQTCSPSPCPTYS